MTTSFRLFFSRKPTICTKTLHSLQGQSSGFHCLMAFSYLCESLISFRLLGTRSHIFGPRFEIFSVLFFFFSIRVFFADTNDSQDSRGKEGTIFYFILPLPPADEHWDIYLELCIWDNYHLLLIATLIYQTATWWDLPPYRITIWVADWWSNVCLFTWWIDTRFLLQRFDIGNQWIRTRIDYHPFIISVLTNQVWYTVFIRRLENWGFCLRL